MVDENRNEEDKVEAEITDMEDLDALKRALAEKQAKAETNLTGWQRAQADFENYKKRSEQEKEETVKFANVVLVLDLVLVLDDLERAFVSLPAELAEVAWVEGIRLIEHKLRTSLEAKGLSEIKALGEPFDPRLHEAIKQDKGDEGIVIEEVQKGYKLHDRVIRPSMVVVGNGGEEDVELDSNNASV